MINDSKQENKVWYSGSGHELQARASGGCFNKGIENKNGFVGTPTLRKPGGK